MRTWVLVANASEATIYATENIRTQNLTLVQELTHPESREKGSDLLADRPGYNQGESYTGSDPKEVEATNFAVELANALKTEFNNNQFKELIIIASPQFYGLLNKHLAISCNQIQHIAKDYTKLKLDELQQQVVKHLFG